MISELTFYAFNVICLGIAFVDERVMDRLLAKA
jgi:hypothetical protein